MATLNVKNFARLVQDQAAAIQTKTSILVDFSVGSILRAISEANAAIGLWLQGLILQVLKLTRAATSDNEDLDTWMNDFGLTRLEATSASGAVTFGRFTATTSAVVPIGAEVETADGTQAFQVVLDTSNSAYSASLSGYLLPIGVSTVTVPVLAVSPASAGNVVTGAVSVMTTAISGVDYVNNAAPFAGGSDAESDPDFRAAFVAYIQALSRGTVPAIKFAITRLKLGVQATVIENALPDGTADYGFLTITVDDGTGAPPSSLLANAQAVVEGYRAGGIRGGVFSPVVLNASISVSIETADGYDHNTLVGLVSSAVTTFVNTLPLGATLPYTKLAQIVYEASPGVTNVACSLNGGTADIVATPRNVVKLSSLTVV
ncbi:baseplate J/gp47 family protein [Xanthobacter versatilis]|uniref:baseplate J/gp47 family protein n=1 Tax=Xanthobacter autotrophicus (strain ATCC BAA-1158 / Py2) TaxID=78245 RepID=UPI0037296B61